VNAIVTPVVDVLRGLVQPARPFPHAAPTMIHEQRNKFAATARDPMTKLFIALQRSGVRSPWAIKSARGSYALKTSVVFGDPRHTGPEHRGEDHQVRSSRSGAHLVSSSEDPRSADQGSFRHGSHLLGLVTALRGDAGRARAGTSPTSHVHPMRYHLTTSPGTKAPRDSMDVDYFGA